MAICSTGAELLAIRESLAHSRFDEIKRLALALISMVGNIGKSRTSKTVLAIETVFKTGTDQECGPLIEDLITP